MSCVRLMSFYKRTRVHFKQISLFLRQQFKLFCKKNAKKMFYVFKVRIKLMLSISENLFFPELNYLNHIFGMRIQLK